MDKSLRVLIAEDSEDDALLIMRELQRGGYDPVFERVDTEEAMKSALAKQAWDIVISDHTMPQFNSLHALKVLQASGLDLPFIIVSGKIGEDVAVAAMKAGANDYVIKGNLARLSPAVERELREGETRRERSRAVAALFERERYFRSLLYNIHEDILVIDRDYHITDLNDSVLRTVGYRREEAIGRHCFEILHGLNAPCSEKGESCPLRRAFETGAPQNCRHEHVRRDGSKVYMDILLSPLKSQKGEVTHVIEAMRDLSDLILTEEALRKSEQRFREMYDYAPVGYHEYDAQGRITDVNRTDLEMLGFTAEEMIGQPVWKFNVEEEAREQILAKLAGTLPPARSLERTYRRKDGTTFPVLCQDRLILNEKGEIKGIRCTIQDITERKLAEKALLESEARYRTLFESSPLPKWLYNPANAVILAVNDAAVERYGYSREEFLSMTIRDIQSPEELEKLAAVLNSKLPQQHNAGIWKQRKKDGTVIEVDVYSHDVILGGQNLRIVTLYDITERKRAEESLKQSEENARQLAQENAVMAEIGRITSSTLNIDEVYEGFAEEVKKIIPFDRIVINLINTEKGTVKNAYVAGKEVRDRIVKEIYPLKGSGNAEMVRIKSTLLIQTENFTEYQSRLPMLWSTFQAGFRSIMNVPLFSKGEIIGGLLLRSLKPYAYTDKEVGLAERIGFQIAGAIANAQLYKERVDAEREKASLEEQFRQSQKLEAVGQLAGGVAHDFNNLLTVIRGYSQLSLSDLKEGDPLFENQKEILEASNRAADLTRQLLAFSRKQVLEFKVLDLNGLIQGTEKMLRRMIGEDIELLIHPEGDLGRVKADPGQMEQVILNLAVNSRDAMPSGGKLILETDNVYLDEEYAHRHISVNPGHYVRLSVSDTGCGMTPEVKKKALEPFFTTKERGKGTGLGLSTVYGIVKQSGGNIWVYSEDGKGTTIKIYLPRVDELAEKLEVKKDVKVIPRGSETVLVVEDEEMVRRLAVLVLEKQGYKVLEAPNGAEAFLVCEQHKGPIDLVVTDVVMPGMSGPEFIDRLRQMRQDFEVLYMSGYTDEAVRFHRVHAKEMAFIQKPFSLEKLTTKVREVLDKAGKHSTVSSGEKPV